MKKENEYESDLPMISIDRNGWPPELAFLVFLTIWLFLVSISLSYM